MILIYNLKSSFTASSERVRFKERNGPLHSQKFGILALKRLESKAPNLDFGGLGKIPEEPKISACWSKDGYVSQAMGR
jgi:hypothetical protein